MVWAIIIFAILAVLIFIFVKKEKKIYDDLKRSESDDEGIEQAKVDAETEKVSISLQEFYTIKKDIRYIKNCVTFFLILIIIGIIIAIAYGIELSNYLKLFLR